MAQKEKKITPKQRRLLVFLLLLGTASLSLTMARSGLKGSLGRGFWGPNGHDGIWHLAVINQALKSFPPPNPVFSGFKLTNYHFGYDLFAALLAKITFLSPSFLYFQFLPVITAFLLGLFSFLVGWGWKGDFWTGFWFAFLNFWAGSWGWLITLAREGQIGGESLFWSMQSASVLLNPPFALSLLFLLWGMLGLLRLNKFKRRSILLLGLLFGLLINIKAYGGVVGLVSLGGYCFFKFLKGERKTVFLFLAAFGFSLITFLITNRGAVSLFEFNPLWFIHSMVESPDRFYWPKLALARYSLLSGGLGPRLILVELIGITIFLLGNLGIRVLGLLDLGRKLVKEKIGDFEYFLLFGLLVSFFPVFFFTQKGTAWNTIQFFYYFLFFLNLYTAVFLGRLSQSKKILAKIVLPALLLVSLPTTFSTLRGYWGRLPPTLLPLAEQEALEFLEQQPEGIVLTFPHNPYLKEDLSAPLPLFVYETTAYVSAFSQKITFLEDEMNLAIINAPWEERKKEVERFFAAKRAEEARGFLVNNQIDYLYLIEAQDLPLSESDLGIKMIFGNKLVRIYQVKR